MPTKPRASQKPNPFPHYYICRVCAVAKGGKGSGGAVTCHKGECLYCGDKDATLCATADYHWPKESGGPAYVWD